MTAIIMILSISALIFTVVQNRRLASQLAALAEAQTVTDERIERLSRKSRKQTNVARKQQQKIERLHRRQREQADRQKRLEQEQRKQAVTMSKMQFKLQTALAEIQHQQNRIAQLYALLDVATLNQAGAVPGSRQDVTAQKQIIALENQIAACEKRIAKAEFDRSQAQEAMKAA